MSCKYTSMKMDQLYWNIGNEYNIIVLYHKLNIFSMLGTSIIKQI